MTKLPSLANTSALGQASPLRAYLHEIAKYPLLEPEEEFALAQRTFDEDDLEAAHRLVTANLRLVIKIANDFRWAQVSLLDLIQEGNFGLMQAVRKFNPYKGVKLSSYAAWWIRAYILKCLLDNSGQVKIATTAAQRKLFYNLQKETDRMLLEQDVVDLKAIAARLDVPERDVIEMQKRLALPDVAMDAEVVSDDGASVRRGELLADTRSEAVDDALAHAQLLEMFASSLQDFEQTLDGRDLELFRRRLKAENPETLHALGEEFGISRERARQLESKILKKLKQFVAERGISG